MVRHLKWVRLWDILGYPRWLYKPKPSCWIWTPSNDPLYTLWRLVSHVPTSSAIDWRKSYLALVWIHNLADEICFFFGNGSITSKYMIWMRKWVFVRHDLHIMICTSSQNTWFCTWTFCDCCATASRSSFMSALQISTVTRSQEKKKANGPMDTESSSHLVGRHPVFTALVWKHIGIIRLEVPFWGST